MIQNHENILSLILILYDILVSAFYSVGLDSYLFTYTKFEKQLLIKIKYTVQFDKAPCTNISYLIDISEIINIYIAHHYLLIYVFSIHILGCHAYIMAYYIILLIDQYKLQTQRECFPHAIYIYIYNVFYIKKSTLFLAHIISILICITCILIAISEMKLSAYWTIYTRYALLYSIQLMHSIAHSVIMTSLRLTSSKTTIHVPMSVCKQIKNRYIECKLFYEQRVILPYC